MAQRIVTIQHQVCEEKSREKDIFLLGMLTTAQHKEEVAHTRHSASATPRDCTTLLYTVKGQKVCRSVFCAVSVEFVGHDLVLTTCTHYIQLQTVQCMLSNAYRGIDLVLHWLHWQSEIVLPQIIIWCTSNNVYCR